MTSTGRAASDPGRQEAGEGGGQVRVTRCGVCECAGSGDLGSPLVRWEKPLASGAKPSSETKGKS